MPYTGNADLGTLIRDITRLFFPFNCFESHWILISLDIKNQFWKVYDSLPPSGDLNVVSAAVTLNVRV